MIQERFGTQRALTYLVGQKFFGFVRDLEDDRNRAPEVADFAAEIRAIFTPEVLGEYFRKARARRHPGKPTDDFRNTPEEALFVAQMKRWLLLEPQSRARP